MTTNEETTNNTPSTSETTPDTHATPSIYIKIDWGHFNKIHDMTYVHNGAYSEKEHDGLWDVRFTVYYRGTIDAKTIKYINITVQAYDRVDEPIGEPFEKKFTGPLEPQNSGIYDYKDFFEGGDYKIFGSLKVVKIIITYMDKTDEEITNEDTIKAMCTSFADKGLELPIMKEPIKTDSPEEPPIFMQFDLGQSDGWSLDLNNLVYIGNKDSKAIRFIDLDFKFFNRAHNVREQGFTLSRLLPPRSKKNGVFWRIHNYVGLNDLNSFSIERIVITYEDNTYVEIPERMIEAMTSKENVDKAEKQLEEILHKEEEAKKAKKAKQKECCSELKNCACDFVKIPNEVSATYLLMRLNKWCANDEEIAANYLTKDLVASACSVALQTMAFDTNNDVTEAHREEAKAFLARFAPDMNSEEAYTQAKRKAEEEQRKAREEEEAKARRKREEEVRKAQEEAKRKIEKKLEEEEAKAKREKLIKDALKAIFWWLILFPLLSGIVCYIIVSIFLTR